MLKLAGAVLLCAGAAALGFSKAARLGERAEVLQRLTSSLRWMERELTFRLTPMAQLFASLTRWQTGPVGMFFGRCATWLEAGEGQPLRQCWEKAVEEELSLLRPEERETLTQLGETLGRYDGEGQRQALAETAERLEQYRAAAREERDRMGRVYSVLGLTAGLTLVIILL